MAKWTDLSTPTIRRNGPSRVSNTPGGPCSTIRPASRTTTWSASTTVDTRCETTIRVIVSPRRLASTCRSVAGSSAVARVPIGPRVTPAVTAIPIARPGDPAARSAATSSNRTGELSRAAMSAASVRPTARSRAVTASSWRPYAVRQREVSTGAVPEARTVTKPSIATDSREVPCPSAMTSSRRRNRVRCETRTANPSGTVARTVACSPRPGSSAETPEQRPRAERSVVVVIRVG